ncbi:hypothetical protein FQR65_LT20237 [Abscondita terminalis]|nr:hypothetical protein FQR65_LT20237 [Abscondita terminalis]
MQHRSQPPHPDLPLGPHRTQPAWSPDITWNPWPAHGLAVAQLVVNVDASPTPTGDSAPYRCWPAGQQPAAEPELDAAAAFRLIQQQHMLPARRAQQARLSSAFSYRRPWGALTASAHSPRRPHPCPTGWSLADTVELSTSGYAWDANGNRTQAPNPACKAMPQDAAAARPSAVGAEQQRGLQLTTALGVPVKKGKTGTCTYGADGRIAKAGEYADASDARGRQLHLTNALVSAYSMSDARGRRPTATLQTLYAEDGIRQHRAGPVRAQPAQRNSAAPAGQSDSTEIIYLPTASGPMPIAAEINGRLYAIHTDHLNTPRRLTNQQGQVAWQWLISGFGEVRPTTGERGYGQTVSGPSYAQAVKFDLRYPGQVFDEETGLSYNLHRYYDAATGRLHPG